MVSVDTALLLLNGYRGGCHGANAGVIVFASYIKQDTNTLGLGGIPISHEKSLMHLHVTEKAGFLVNNFNSMQ